MSLLSREQGKHLCHVHSLGQEDSGGVEAVPNSEQAPLFLLCGEADWLEWSQRGVVSLPPLYL